jgi:hypothetical protein
MRIIAKRLALVVLLAAGASFLAHADRTIEAGKFSALDPGDPPPSGWEPLYFKKISAHTVYSLIKDADVTVVKAVSDAAASGLMRKITIDPKQHPVIEWRWKVDNVIQNSDVRRKDGDDYAARVYITFAYEPEKAGLGRKVKYQTARVLFGEVPIGTISYIWENKAEKDTLAPNPYTDFVRMIVVRNGASPRGVWLTERRNVYEDYKRAFGEEPPLISGIAIMTDSDNTGESVTAYYGDIVFKAR